MRVGFFLFTIILILGPQSYAFQVTLFPKVTQAKTEAQIQRDLDNAGASCPALNQAREDLINRANWINNQKLSNSKRVELIERVNFAIDSVDVQILDNCV